MEKKLNKALDELISFVKNTNDYKKCLEIKEKLGESDDVERLVKDIKKYQKEYVKTNDNEILKIVDMKKNELNEIPIYKSYMFHLGKVNDMIEIVKEKLNNYFDSLVN